MNKHKPEYTLKLVVVGNSYVGKTSLIKQLLNKHLPQQYAATSVCVSYMFFSVMSFSLLPIFQSYTGHPITVRIILTPLAIAKSIIVTVIWMWNPSLSTARKSC